MVSWSDLGGQRKRAVITGLTLVLVTATIGGGYVAMQGTSHAASVPAARPASEQQHPASDCEISLLIRTFKQKNPEVSTADEAAERSFDKFLDEDKDAVAGAIGSCDLSGRSNNDTSRPPGDNNPVARFSLSAYQDIANLGNSEFIRLRNAVVNADGTPSRITALKASFFSNNCTLVPDVVAGDATDACKQHDFRYTIGPTVITEFDAQSADRAAADKQLGDAISNLPTADSTVGSFMALVNGLRGFLFHYATKLGGCLPSLGGINWCAYSPLKVNEEASFATMQEVYEAVGLPILAGSPQVARPKRGN